MRPIIVLLSTLFTWVLVGCVSTISEDTDEDVFTYGIEPPIWEGYKGNVPDYRNLTINTHTNALPPPTMADYSDPSVDQYYSDVDTPYITALIDYRKYLDKYINEKLVWYEEHGKEINVSPVDMTCRDFRIDIDDYPLPPPKPTLEGIKSKAIAYEIYREYVEVATEHLIENRRRFLEDYNLWLDLCVD